MRWCPHRMLNFSVALPPISYPPICISLILSLIQRFLAQKCSHFLPLQLIKSHRQPASRSFIMHLMIHVYHQPKFLISYYCSFWTSQCYCCWQMILLWRDMNVECCHVIGGFALVRNHLLCFIISMMSFFSTQGLRHEWQVSFKLWQVRKRSICCVGRGENAFLWTLSNIRFGYICVVFLQLELLNKKRFWGGWKKYQMNVNFFFSPFPGYSYELCAYSKYIHIRNLKQLELYYYNTILNM